MKTILQDKKECYVCSATYGLHDHHIFYGTACRAMSEKYGLKVWLCGKHHNLSDEGVHFNKELDTHLKRKAQRVYEGTYGTREDFRRDFIRSYL